MHKLAKVALILTTVAGCSTMPSGPVPQQPVCDNTHYHCVKIEKGDTWYSIFPNADDRRLVQAVNRTNLPLHRRSMIYVPTALHHKAHYAPFPQHTHLTRKHIVVNLNKKAYAAYHHGKLVRWGPIAAGKTCNTNADDCSTPKGKFRIFRMHGPECKSSKYPRPHGGAPMPHCMFFNGGVAFHGGLLPGRHASKGCVRLLYEDAYWMRNHFVKHGTKVIVK